MLKEENFQLLSHLISIYIEITHEYLSHDYYCTSSKIKLHLKIYAVIKDIDPDFKRVLIKTAVFFWNQTEWILRNTFKRGNVFLLLLSKLSLTYSPRRTELSVRVAELCPYYFWE